MFAHGTLTHSLARSLAPNSITIYSAKQNNSRAKVALLLLVFAQRNPPTIASTNVFQRAAFGKLEHGIDVRGQCPSLIGSRTMTGMHCRKLYHVTPRMQCGFCLFPSILGACF